MIKKIKLNEIKGWQFKNKKQHEMLCDIIKQPTLEKCKDLSKHSPPPIFQEKYYNWDGKKYYDLILSINKQGYDPDK